MEVTIGNSSDVKVCGMMHLLISDHFESKDHLYQRVEDVYNNFTLIRKVAIALLDDMKIEFPEESKYVKLREEIGFLITFCRCTLRRIFEEDGITINASLADLLAQIELHLLDLVNQSVSKWSLFGEMESETGEAYEPSPINCYQLIKYDLMMEFLDDCLEDLNFSNVFKDIHTSLELNFTVLRNYLELSTKEGIDGDSELLIAVENSAYEMASCFFFPTMSGYKMSFDRTNVLSRLRFGVLKALVLQSRSFDIGASLMSDELVIGYVKCVRDNLLELLEDNAIDITDALEGQLMNLHEGLSFLMYLLITCPRKHNSELSGIRLDFQALAREVGSVIISCLESGKMSFGLPDLIEEADDLERELINTIFCVVFQETVRESSKTDQQSSLILLIQSLKEFIDCKPGLTVTWKDHENLIIFVLYLIQNNIEGDDHIADDDFSQSTLGLNVELINHEELDGVLVSAQVVAFNMACYSLLKRHGKFCWWDMYLRNKEHIDMHMRVGILKAIVLSSTTPWTIELVIAYGECVEDSLIELLRNAAFDPVKDHFNILHKGFSFLWRLLINYRDEEQKLSHIKVGFQDLVRSVGSEVCSCFRNWPREKQSTTEPSKLIEKMNLIIVETGELLHLVNLKKIGRDSPKTNQMGSLNLLLENWEGFMECESDLITTWKDQFQMIHENLILFNFFITSSSTRDDESKNICSSIMDVVHVAEYLLGTFSIGICPVSCASIWISGITEHVELINAAIVEFEEIYSNKKEISARHDQSQVPSKALLVQTPTLKYEVVSKDVVVGNDIVMGFEVEIKLILDRLFAPLQQLDVISIVGMSGLGKTTLARKVYEDRRTINHFDARAWCSISKKYNMRDLYIAIVDCITVVTDYTKEWSEEDLALLMNKLLFHRRYLIVLDDIWDINVFMDLKRVFPDGYGRSRVMVTTRSEEIGLQAQTRYMNTIIPRLLTDEESWVLLVRKIYNERNFPAELREIGMKIAKRCKGLPLAVVVIAGVLAKGPRKRDFWEQVMRNISSYLVRDEVVGFEGEMEFIRKQLHGHLRQLDVICIVGMPGLGKTTLARNIYDDPFTINYFDARVWCCVSREYNKREMLLSILGSIIQLTNEIRSQEESELSVMVHKQLKGRRYIIVLDDIWDIKAFMYLKRFFPDDNKGSRVILTTRSKVIGSQAQGQCHRDPIEPGFLTDEQSWDLLARKVFNTEKRPDELCQIGKEIAKKCKGLPLAVVVVGGVLAKGIRKPEFWQHVMRNLSSYLARDSQSRVMAALELSYEFLPNYLKPMFLYLGAFPEDAEISVDKLMRFWSAEGFLQDTQSSSLEIQAETSLRDLIDRSLVTVAKRRWDGRVKACHVHDLLRDMCLTKAKQEKFLQQVRVQNGLADPILYQRRLSILLEKNDETNSRHLVAYRDLSQFAIIPPIYSLLFFHVGPDKYHRASLRDIISSLKLLQIFDAQFFIISQDVLDKDLIMLIHLRYVSFYADVGLKSIPTSISRLRSLETLIINHGSDDSLNVPETIWEMTKLKHLHINSIAKFSVETENSFILYNLQTLSTPVFDLGDEEKIFKKVPGLKKLSCFFHSYERDCLFVNFKSLSKLESLRVNGSAYLGGQLKLPETLRKLSISGLCLEWSEISIFHTLPNLEVLKLKFKSTKDEVWDMGDDEVFAELKVLKLEDLNIEKWYASCINFPRLEKLVLHQCNELIEMPSEMGGIDTLREIHVRGQGSSFAVKLAKEIQEEQEKFGNDSLKFYIHEEH